MTANDNCSELLLKPASASQHEFPGFLSHGRISRVSLLRDLFQRGKPIPIEDLDSEDQINGTDNTLKLSPNSSLSSSNSTTPRFFADLKDECLLQKLLQKQAKDAQTLECGTDEIVKSRVDKGQPETEDSQRKSALENESLPNPANKKSSSHVDDFAVVSSEESKVQQKSCDNVILQYTESERGSSLDDTMETNKKSAFSPLDGVSTVESNSLQTFVVKPTAFQSSQPSPQPVLPVLQALHEEVVALSTPESNNSPERQLSEDRKDTELAEDDVADVDDENDDDEEEEDEDYGSDEGKEELDWQLIDEEEKENKQSEFALPSYLKPVAISESGIHLFEDGNFFYQASGLPPIAILDGFSSLSENDEERNKEGEEPTPKSPDRRSVHFSTKPITVFSTYSVAAYRRRNESIDPIVASAEYELEKRLEDLDLFNVDLNKGTNGLGISILGMGLTFVNGVEKLGIFVKAITPGGAADVDGRMRVYDQLVEVDGQCLVGVSQTFAATVLRNTSGTVRFVVGREKGDIINSIASLMAADNEMATSTCSSNCNSDGTDENRHFIATHMKRDDSVETLRKLLADASATAAKAHQDDEYDNFEEDDEDEEFLDNEEDEADDDEGATTSDTLADECDAIDGRGKERRIVFRHEVQSANCLDMGVCSSSDAGLSMSDSEPLHQKSAHDVDKEMSKLRIRDLTISRMIQEAVEHSSTSSTYRSDDLEISPDPTTLVAAMRMLASDLLNSQSQAKRLKARVRRLGQRLTDQEAAADEAIERLCLRCHNLETRLLDKQPRTATTNPTATTNLGDLQRVTNAGRLSPVVEGGNDSEEEAEKDDNNYADRRHEDREEGDSEFRLSELQSKYFSLNTLYEAALKREGVLNIELCAKDAQLQKMINDSEHQNSNELALHSAVEKTVSDNKGAIDPAPLLKSRSFSFSPRPRLALPRRRSLDTTASGERLNSNLDDESDSPTSPPPRPPKPTRSLSPATTATSLSQVNLSQMPEAERWFMERNPFYAVNQCHLYAIHQQRIRLGTSGAFATKRLPSRPNCPTISEAVSPTHSLSLVPPPDSRLADLELSKIAAVRCSVSHSPISNPVKSSPPLPFHIPLPGLRDAIAGLKPSHKRSFGTTTTASTSPDAIQLTSCRSLLNTTETHPILTVRIASTETSPKSDVPQPINASAAEQFLSSPNISNESDEVFASTATDTSLPALSLSSKDISTDANYSQPSPTTPQPRLHHHFAHLPTSPPPHIPARPLHVPHLLTTSPAILPPKPPPPPLCIDFASSQPVNNNYFDYNASLAPGDYVPF